MVLKLMCKQIVKISHYPTYMQILSSKLVRLALRLTNRQNKAFWLIRIRKIL
jgi:hypothetical protein